MVLCESYGLREVASDSTPLSVITRIPPAPAATGAAVRDDDDGGG